MKCYLLALALILACSTSAHAKDWQVDYAHSKLGFTGDQSGQKFEGGFKKFDAQISFDPDHPDSGKIAVTVDISSIGTGDEERDSYLPQKEWFFQSTFPTAQFTATTFRKTGVNTYEAAGNLTIKGISRPVTLPFTLTPEGDHWRAKGHITLMRNDFSLGTGSFAKEDYVKNGVDVTVDLAATPKP